MRARRCTTRCLRRCTARWKTTTGCGSRSSPATSRDRPRRSSATPASRRRVVGPMAAALTKFDAYLTSDFTWTRLLHDTCRIQMFHGVGGKYGFDAPTEPLDAWHRLFFVNRRRLNNCIAVGRARRRQPGDPADRHAEGRLPGRRFAGPRRACFACSACRRIARRCSTRRPGRRPRR